jgi:DNA-directed RNA polymerase subunit beta
VHRPLVSINEKVFAGQILVDEAGTDNGELAIGCNVLVAYMSWEGGNHEDAFVVSERLVYENIMTSVHVERFSYDFKARQVGSDKVHTLTNDIPYVAQSCTDHLGLDGIIEIGSWVNPGDILIGKVTYSEGELDPLDKFVRAILKKKEKPIINSSLKAPRGLCGRVLDVKTFASTLEDITIQVFIAQSRRIQVGDKLAGRHGNKGVISRIVPVEDMPFLQTGHSVDVLFNPLGVPSRMNVGQLYEGLLGRVADTLNVRFKIPPFDERYGDDMSRAILNYNLEKLGVVSQVFHSGEYSGKLMLRDGRTGFYFENPVAVGTAYMLKLIHVASSKVHARAIGPYARITQQPLGGRSRKGGQRFGEMEVWALEAYGAVYNLRELLTIKSDDLIIRDKLYAELIEGRKAPGPQYAATFHVLLAELQALCIDITAHTR